MAFVLGNDDDLERVLPLDALDELDAAGLGTLCSHISNETNEQHDADSTFGARGDSCANDFLSLDGVTVENVDVHNRLLGEHHNTSGWTFVSGTNTNKSDERCGWHFNDYCSVIDGHSTLVDGASRVSDVGQLADLEVFEIEKANRECKITQRSLQHSSKLSAKSQVQRKRGAYACTVCGLPKRGHKCTGSGVDVRKALQFMPESDARIVCGSYEKPLLSHDVLIEKLSHFTCPTAVPNLEFYLIVESGTDGIWEIFRGVVIGPYYNAKGGQYRCKFDDGVWPVHWKDSFNTRRLIIFNDCYGIHMFYFTKNHFSFFI